MQQYIARLQGVITMKQL